tara:strand:+ start:5354 stop:6235 length:882 start_codon:yes stop_codon:yes gene_type:complete
MRNLFVRILEKISKAVEIILLYLAPKHKIFDNAFIERINLDLKDIKRKLFFNDEIPGYKVVAEDDATFSDNDCEFPIADRRDDTRHQRLVNKSEKIFNKKIKFLDLGCAGGGLVFDFLTKGHEAIGIEGSDFPEKSSLAHWHVIPNNLFTADLTKPLKIYDSGNRLCVFDLISAWEVMEHIAETDINQFINNLLLHMSDEGLFICSVSTVEFVDKKTGIAWHKTVQDKNWWVEKFKQNGLIEADTNFGYLDFSRGSSNLSASDWDSKKNPELGFHLVLKKMPKGELESSWDVS